MTLERERQPPSSSERLIYRELTDVHHCPLSSSLAVSLPLEVYLDALAPHWFDAPHLVVHPPRGLQTSSDGPVTQPASPSSGFRPASESYPRSPRFHINTVANALPRFVAPSALPNQRKPPFPGLPFPGHVASSHLPCALTPCSFVGLPGVFQPGSLLGFHPSALCSPEIVLASRHDFPLLCLAQPGTCFIHPKMNVTVAGVSVP
jgi:hypothetical protein